MLRKPKDIWTNSNKPKGVVSAILGMSASSTGINQLKCLEQVNLSEDGRVAQSSGEVLVVCVVLSSNPVGCRYLGICFIYLFYLYIYLFLYKKVLWLLKYCTGVRVLHSCKATNTHSISGRSLCNQYYKVKIPSRYTATEFEFNIINILQINRVDYTDEVACLTS